MKYSLNYLIKHNRDYSKHDIYIKIFALVFTTLPTWVVLNFTKLSANAITFIGLFFGVLGAILGYFISIEFVLYGFIVFLICDFMDGNVASAKGGGSFLGAILDMLSDRFILMISVLALVFYHIESNEESEVLLLIIYILIFLFMDIMLLAFYIAKEQKQIVSPINTKRKEINNEIREILSEPLIWIPTRLGSYLFVILTYFITDSLLIAYEVGIAAVVLSLAATIVTSNFAKSYMTEKPRNKG